MIKRGNEQTFKAFVFAVAGSLWDLKEGAWYFVDYILTLVSTFSLNSSGGGHFLAAPFPETGKNYILGVAELPRCAPSLWFIGLAVRVLQGELHPTCPNLRRAK